jgi:tRNA pseudouridine55 synthase
MNGVINIYKPIGVTSFDVVRKVMKVCKTKKVGHTGTLDPLASGVLPICIGRATKIVEYIMSDIKEYRVQLKLGITTDSYDREGKILNENDTYVSKELIINAISKYTGDIDQEPPMYSALKVNGKRLYELARQGITVERQKRKIHIYKIDIASVDYPYADFTVTCSKGTYIRSLCYDIGKDLGVGGTMWSLERTKSGMFNSCDSIDFHELNEELIHKNLISIDEALKNYDVISFNNKYGKLLLNGVKMNNEYLIKNIEIDKMYRVYIDNEDFIGLGQRDDEGFKIIKLLN